MSGMERAHVAKLLAGLVMIVIATLLQVNKALAQVPYNGCGYVRAGVECSIFYPDTGGRFFLWEPVGTTTSYYIHVKGLMSTDCATWCMQVDGCIGNDTIEDCPNNPPYHITASHNSHGSVTPAGVTIVDSGGSQTYAITPDSGYRVVSVIVDGFVLGSITTYSFTNVTAHHSINATFAIIPYQSTITASTGPNGSVVPDCVTTLNYAGSQIYQITPNPCYHVADVLVDGVSVGAVSTYSFTTVTANHTINANFGFTIQTVTASAGPHGTIVPSGPVQVNCGSDQAFLIAPDLHYFVRDVVVDGNSVGPVTNYMLADVTKDLSISATFVCCVGKRGDVNLAGIVDLADLSTLVSYLTGSGFSLPCDDAANVNGTGIVDLADLSALVSYLTGGVQLSNCP